MSFLLAQRHFNMKLSMLFFNCNLPNIYAQLSMNDALCAAWFVNY